MACIAWSAKCKSAQICTHTVIRNHPGWGVLCKVLVGVDTIHCVDRKVHLHPPTLYNGFLNARARPQRRALVRWSLDWQMYNRAKRFQQWRKVSQCGEKLHTVKKSFSQWRKVALSCPLECILELPVSLQCIGSSAAA